MGKTALEKGSNRLWITKLRNQESNPGKPLSWRKVKHLLQGTKQGVLASLVAQLVKNLPAMQETWVWSVGREDPLEQEMETCSGILA